MDAFFKKLITVYALITAGMISGNAQSIVLPDFSNVYPDTFAIYWKRTEKINLSKENYSIQVKCTSLYDDLIFETGQSTDSILSLPFIAEHADEEEMLVYASFFKNDKRIIDRLSQPINFKILSRSDKIEALKSLVDTNASIQNLKLLADALEEEKCFANAFHIYHRMVLKSPVQGRKHFVAFYEKNYKIFTPVRNSVAR